MESDFISSEAYIIYKSVKKANKITHAKVSKEILIS